MTMTVTRQKFLEVIYEISIPELPMNNPKSKLGDGLGQNLKLGL